jgi:hypothetical protein
MTQVTLMVIGYGSGQIRRLNLYIWPNILKETWDLIL